MTCFPVHTNEPLWTKLGPIGAASPGAHKFNHHDALVEQNEQGEFIEGWRLSSMTCRYGERIDSLTATYENPNHRSVTYSAGGLGGSHEGSLTIKEEDPIVHVKSHRCTGQKGTGHVCGIKFYTKSGYTLAQKGEFYKIDSQTQVLTCGVVVFSMTDILTFPPGKVLRFLAGTYMKEIESLDLYTGPSV